MKVNILPAEAQDLALPKAKSYRYDPSAGVPPFKGDRKNQFPIAGNIVTGNGTSSASCVGLGGVARVDVFLITSPPPPVGNYEVAFQANTTNLWTVGSDNHGDWKLGMAANTSPSITG